MTKAVALTMKFKDSVPMPKITFVAFDGTEHTVEGQVGESVMRSALANNIPGIDADCGGQCACATCHVFVDDRWLGLTGTASEDESRLLEFSSTVQDNSRLSCQITIRDDLDGLVVRLPQSQH
jgi:ferredoxin, 2Fe-2S